MVTDIESTLNRFRFGKISEYTLKREIKEELGMEDHRLIFIGGTTEYAREGRREPA